MAKGFKSGGKDFEKGKSANPGGLPRVSPKIKELSAYARALLIQKYHEVHTLTEEELYARMKDPKVQGAEKAIVSIMIHAIKYGDQNRFGALVERVCGKVKEEVEHSIAKPTIIIRPNGDRVSMGVIEEDEK